MLFNAFILQLEALGLDNKRSQSGDGKEEEVRWGGMEGGRRRAEGKIVYT